MQTQFLGHLRTASRTSQGFKRFRRYLVIRLDTASGWGFLQKNHRAQMLVHQHSMHQLGDLGQHTAPELPVGKAPKLCFACASLRLQPFPQHIRGVAPQKYSPQEKIKTETMPLRVPELRITPLYCKRTPRCGRAVFIR